MRKGSPMRTTVEKSNSKKLAPKKGAHPVKAAAKPSRALSGKVDYRVCEAAMKDPKKFEELALGSRRNPSGGN